MEANTTGKIFWFVTKSKHEEILIKINPQAYTCGVCVNFRLFTFTFAANEPDIVIGGGECFFVVFALSIDRLPCDHQ